MDKIITDNITKHYLNKTCQVWQKLFFVDGHP